MLELIRQINHATAVPAIQNIKAALTTLDLLAHVSLSHCVPKPEQSVCCRSMAQFVLKPGHSDFYTPMTHFVFKPGHSVSYRSMTQSCSSCSSAQGTVSSLLKCSLHLTQSHMPTVPQMPSSSPAPLQVLGLPARTILTVATKTTPAEGTSTGKHM